MTADWYIPHIFTDIEWCNQYPNDRYVFPAEVLRRISSRITNEVAGINRVTYDISSKPPSVRIIIVLNSTFRR